MIALAEALGLPFEIKQVEYNRLHSLGPRLLGHSLVSLTRKSRAQMLSERPPDLTISAGHRSVPLVLALRCRSADRMRSIHIGFPRISPAHFDLVIATPQYPIPDHPNLLRVPYALTRAATMQADPLDTAGIGALPAPRRLLIVGGPTLYWKIDEGALLGTLSAILEEARSGGGSALVTTSPRTPAALKRRIAAALKASNVPSILAEPKRSPGYASLLAGADSIRITADSVAMVSDAIWTGKPVGLIPVTKSALGRAAFALMDFVRPGKRIYPQDLRFFWRALTNAGVTEHLAAPTTSTEDEMRTVLDRAQAISMPLFGQENGGRGKD